MKKFELTLWILAVIALTLKIGLIPGGSILLLLSLACLSLLYLFFGFAYLNNIPFKGIFKSASYQNTNTKRIIFAILMGMALSHLIIGYLFKIMLYPGRTYQLQSGLVTVTIGLIVLLLVKFKKDKDIFYYKTLKRGVIMLFIGASLYFINDNVLVDIYYRDKGELKDIYKELLKHPEDDALRREFFEKMMEREMQEMEKKRQGM